MRNEVSCPRFCDTVFTPVGSTRMTGAGLLAAILGLSAPCLVVFTGGEPLLQLDEALLTLLRSGLIGYDFAVETNGTVAPAFDPALIDHWCVSPKVPVGRLAIREGTELKVVVPSYDPGAYDAILDGFEHLLVSPEARSTDGVPNHYTARAIRFVQENPRWRLSIQTHKLLLLR